MIFDTRDDPLEPKRGIFLGADLQLSLQALGGVSYLKGFFQATSVRRLRADLVFVLSARLGLAGSFGGEPPLLPQPERFFAGGDYGPRGFPVDGLGPKLVGTDGQLYPTGGNAVALGGAELRYNFSRAFQLASFLDNGNVFLETRNLDPRPGCGGARASACATARPSAPCGSTGATSWTRSPATTGAPTSTSRSAMRSSSLALVAALVPGLALAQAAPPPARVETVERIVAVVDERPLLCSDVRALRRCAASPRSRPARRRSTSG